MLRRPPPQHIFLLSFFSRIQSLTVKRQTQTPSFFFPFRSWQRLRQVEARLRLLELAQQLLLPPPQLGSHSLESRVVLLRIQGLGFKDPTLWPFFAGERKSGSLRQGFESLLPGKKHPKLPKISQIWATFGTTNFFAVFSAFLRVYPFGVNRDYCKGSFLWNFGIRI
jgi:hypothetical protein